MTAIDVSVKFHEKRNGGYVSACENGSKTFSSTSCTSVTDIYIRILEQKTTRNGCHNRINRFILYAISFHILQLQQSLGLSYKTSQVIPLPCTLKQGPRDACHTSVSRFKSPILTGLSLPIQLRSVQFRGKGEASRVFRIIFRCNIFSFYTQFQTNTEHLANLP